MMRNGAYLLKRGDTADLEDAEATHRLRIARSILSHLGIEPTWKHSDYQAQVTKFGAPRHVCDTRCRCSWPQWVTDAVFELAWDLADEVQGQRGAFERKRAYQAKREREVATGA